MPIFGRDAAQDAYIENLISRVSTLEGYSLNTRLGVLEAYNANARIAALESLNISSRLITLETKPTPTLASLGAESSGAETRAKSYTDTKIAALTYPTPTRLEHFYGYAAKCYNGTQDKTFGYTVNTSYEFGRYASIASPAQNDVYEVEFYLAPGNYNLTFLHDKGTTRGIVSVYFDDYLLGTIDAYASATAAVNRTSFTIVVSSSNLHTLKLKVLSKNGSSTGYAFNCTGIFINPVKSQTTVRVNCGGNRYIDSYGQEWLPDSYFSGGSAYDIEQYIGAFTVTGTNDPTLYKFERSAEPGTFSYTIPIVSGVYTVNLLFAENNKTGVGQRVGNISLNGTTILANFDVYAQSSGQHKALIKTFLNQSLSAFTLTISNTLINGIELIKTA